MSSTIETTRADVQEIERPVHDFLINNKGEPAAVVWDITHIREHIDSIPETSASFTLRDVDETDARSRAILDTHVEFAGAWPFHDKYNVSGYNGARRFVNPKYAHAEMYSDVVSQCECGAYLNVSYDDDRNVKMEVEHEHTDDCKQYHRLEARAALLRRRESAIKRLTTQFGWDSRQVSTRIGLSKSTLSGNIDLSVGDLRKEYYELSGNTHAYLVSHTDLLTTESAEIYGVSRGTMCERVRKYTDYEYDERSGKWVIP